MEIIRCEKLAFGYGLDTLIQDLDFAVLPGDFIGIVGPNGSGKSTLLKLLSGVLNPDGGKILFGAEPLEEIDNKELACQMAVVPQSTEVLYNFSTYDIVAMGRYPHQRRWNRHNVKDHEIIRESMEATGTWQFKDDSIHNLSGGEKQRVMIARALAQKPQIILLDEPTSSLDINYQVEIFDLLQELNEQGMTILTVLHDLNLASQYCDQLLLLKEGQIHAQGTPEEVVTVENIQEVYNTDVIVSRKYSGRPYVTLLSRRRLAQVNKELPQVHLICGGGSGLELIHWLVEAGYPLTGGVVNQGDSDWQLLLENNRRVVEERPFSAINEESYAELYQMLDDAERIIVANLPFGPGNVANLEALLEIIDKKPQPMVILFSETDIEERDFTGGKATEKYQQLLQKGAREVKDREELQRVFHKGGTG